MGTTVVPR